VKNRLFEQVVRIVSSFPSHFFQKLKYSSRRSESIFTGPVIAFKIENSRVARAPRCRGQSVRRVGGPQGRTSPGAGA
jgi:hypothetical protein